MEKNHQFVAYIPMDCNWLYIVKMNAEMISGTTLEVYSDTFDDERLLSVLANEGGDC